MNAEETGRLVATIASVCPQQPLVAPNPSINEPGTAAYWWPLLREVRFEDAVMAAQRLAQRQPFIGVSEIIATVAAIRAERLDAMPQNKRPAPNVDPADVRRYAAGVRAIERAIADGEIGSDGNGGYVLESARWHRAITAGPGAQAVKREVDYSRVFAERRAVLRAEREEAAAQDRAAREAERRERERQLAALAEMQAAYEKARAARLARRRRLSKKTAKSLSVRVDGATIEEPQAERDAAAS